ncbi:MAG: helix-turn-helix domain-containing protein [candidate division NC10 bacterium]|nr:helix-turn-helix domain-containing protein [candidate division NC10 bacterium]
MKAPGELEKVRVIEGVALKVDLDPYLSLKALANYSGLSVRKLRDALTDPFRPLPHYRVGGKLLVKRSEFDTWMRCFRQTGRPDVDRVVEEVVRELTAKQ